MAANRLQFLGIIRKANALLWGARLLEGIRKNEVYLVLISNAASDRTHKQLMDKCAFYKIPCFDQIEDELLAVYSDQKVVAFGITQQKMALKLVNEMRCSYGKTSQEVELS